MLSEWLTNVVIPRILVRSDCGKWPSLSSQKCANSNCLIKAKVSQIGGRSLESIHRRAGRKFPKKEGKACRTSQPWNQGKTKNQPKPDAAPIG